MKSNTKKIMNKVIAILNNNKAYQEAVKDRNETAEKFPHWGLAETPEQLVRVWDDGSENEVVSLSNEGSVRLTDSYYNEFYFNLDDDFNKAGLHVEAYDGGSFHVYKA